MSEVQALRQELADTQKKLQGYADAAISLYNELRVLRESICNTCKFKERLVPNMAVTPSPLVAGTAASSSSSFRNRPSETAAKPTNFWRRILKGKQRPERNGSPDPLGSATPNLPTPTNFVALNSTVFLDPPEALKSTQIPPTLPLATEKSVTVSRPMSKPSSRVITPKPSAPKWSVRRTANTTLNATFVRSFTLKHRVISVKFSADGKYLASAGGAGSVAIFEVETGKQTCTLVEYASQYSSEVRSGFMCVRFSQNGRYLAVADMASRVIVWDISKKRMRNIFKGHTSEVHSVDFSPNGRLVASACCDCTVRIWNTRDGSSKVFSDNSYEFLCLRFSPNGRYVAAGNMDRVLRIWDIRTGRLVKRWIGHDDFICSVAFTADGRGLVSSGASGTLKFWDISSLGMVQSGGAVATELQKYYGHSGVVRCAVNSPDTRWIASASEDKTAILWDTHTAMRQCTLLGHEDAVFSTDFSPAGTYLATGSQDARVALWRYSST